MPRDRTAERKAERLEERRQVELERKREEERDRQREEERRERDRTEALERDREEEQRRERAEQARAKSRERNREERRAREAEAERALRRLLNSRAESRIEDRDARQQAERAAARRAAAQGAQRHSEARAAAAAQRQDERKTDQEASDRNDAKRAQRLKAAQESRKEQQQTKLSEAGDAHSTREETLQEQRKQERAEQRLAERREQEAAQARADERQRQRAVAQAAERMEQVRRDAAAQRSRERRSSTLTPPTSARVPSGRLSNGLAWLKVAGNRIVSVETERAVLLRGVNRSGLEYAAPNDSEQFIDAAHITESEIDTIVSEWGANIIRLPFNQDVALNGRGTHSPAEYLDNLDQIIYWASERGAYTLLDLQWLDPTTPFGVGNQVPPLPNLDSLLVWQLLATRYQQEPAVLYDIFNEPHDPLPTDGALLEGIDDLGVTSRLATRSVTMAIWQPWARQLVRAIRRTHPNSLIFVSGVDWGYDLRGMPLTVIPGGPEVFVNLVYSTHVYPGKGPPVMPSAAVSTTGLNWEQAFGRLAATLPVFAGEWGVDEGAYDTDADAAWADRLTSYMSGLGMGWAAWSWADKPRIVRNAQAGQYEPTRFGRIVQRALAIP